MYGFLFRLALIFRTVFGKVLKKISLFNAKTIPYKNLLRFLLHSYKFENLSYKCSLGKRFQILGKIKIRVEEGVAIRDNVLFVGNGILVLKKNAVINNNIIITAYGRIEIGQNVMIGAYCYILDIDHKFENGNLAPMAEQGYSIAPVIIEDDVWIGSHCIITKGVNIGKGSVVGANSVVTKDIPPYSVCVGSPARAIKSRI